MSIEWAVVEAEGARSLTPEIGSLRADIEEDELHLTRSDDGAITAILLVSGDEPSRYVMSFPVETSLDRVLGYLDCWADPNNHNIGLAPFHEEE